MQIMTEKAPNKLPETGRQEAVAAEHDPKSARKEAINDMKRVHIMDAALKVIARDGYIGARLEDIAEEAGFSKAAIYHYFPDREALFMNIIVRDQRATYEECVKIAERGLPFGDTLREMALTFYERMFTVDKVYGMQQGGLAPSPSAMSSLFLSATKHEDLFNASIASKNDTFNLLVRVISKAKQDGVLTVPIDDKTICLFMVSFFQTFIMESFVGTPMISGQTNDPPRCGMVNREDFNKMLDSMFVFLSPWIKEGKDA